MIRGAAVAGMFYPGSSEKINDAMTMLFENAHPELEYEHIGGLIAPHAGYQYSGLTAAHAYKLLKGASYSTVIVLSPSHREFFRGCSIYEGDGYETPLGVVSIDQEIAQKLIDHDKKIFFGSEGHGLEHALEVQLPFLQTVLDDFRIVPLVMGDQRKENIDILANALASVMNETILVVASSDLSHFYSRSVATRMDGLIAEHIDNFDPDGLLALTEEKKSEACGAGLMIALMKACKQKGYEKSKILHRSDSGDTTGDTSEVVGYLSAAIYR